MSVLITLRVKGDGAKLEELVSANPELLTTISNRGREFGVEYHRFYATDDEIMVVDMWPDAESFQRFSQASPEIPGVMAQVGATAAPEITFYRKLDTGDDIG